MRACLYAIPARGIINACSGWKPSLNVGNVVDRATLCKLAMLRTRSHGRHICTIIGRWLRSSTRPLSATILLAATGDTASSNGSWSAQTSGSAWSLVEMASELRPVTMNLPCSPVQTFSRGQTVQFEVRSGDVWHRDALRGHNAERSEIAQQSVGSSSNIWTAFTMMVMPGTATAGKWVELGQLHNRRDYGERSPSPAVSQGFSRGDVFRIETRFSTENPLQQNPLPTRLYTDRSFRRGVPYHFLYHIVYSPDDNGLVDVWINGAHRVNYRGPVGYIDMRPPYWKFGIYREPSPESMTVRYSGIATCS